MSESLSFNLTQLKDLEYICELAQLYLKGTGGVWPERIERYRGQLLNRIEELEAPVTEATAQPPAAE